MVSGGTAVFCLHPLALTKHAHVWTTKNSEGFEIFQSLKLNLRCFHQTVCVWISCILFNPPASQICGVPLRCFSGSELSTVLRSRRSVDAERLTGGHAGYCGNGPPKARADRFLPAVGWKRPTGGQRGSGPVDGHGTVATSAQTKKKNHMNETSPPCGLWALLSGCVWPLNCEHAEALLNHQGEQ